MNILVTGGRGQLGSELQNIVLDSQSNLKGAKDKYLFSARSEDGLESVSHTILDVTDKVAVRKCVVENDINLIVNCAAYTNVEGAEDDFVNADKVNRIAVGNLAEICLETGAQLIHISTDFVFDGTFPNNAPAKPYSEKDKTNPLSVYGSTKLAGEQAIINSGADYIILRTSWLYSSYGKNFMKTMLRLMNRSIEDKNSEKKNIIKVVADQIGTPTYAADLASAIIYIISTRQHCKTGLYNFSNLGTASWYDFANMIQKISDSPAEVIPCTTEEFPMKAQRPHYSLLDKKLITETFSLKIPHWIDALERALKHEKLIK